MEAFVLKNGLQKVDVSSLRKGKPGKLWIDVSGITGEDADLLGRLFGLHPLTKEDLVVDRTRIKTEEFPGYLFSVFYGIRWDGSPKTSEIDFVLGKDFLITNHNERVESIERLKENKQRISRLLSRGPDMLFHRLLDNEIDGFFPALERLDDEIDDMIEEATNKTDPEQMARILEMKRTVSAIRKIVVPQREKISNLAKVEYRFVSRKAAPYFRDVYDHAIRVTDTVDSLREAASSAFDVYMTSVSNNMNEVMKTLSIIATIALPLTVISGIYGTNFSVIPGADYAYGFWAMLGTMAAISLIMLIYFRSRKWF